MSEPKTRQTGLAKYLCSLCVFTSPFGARWTEREDIPLDDVEGAVRGALTPVKPPPGFRTHLQNNLELAARGRLSGLALEYPKPYREGILIGLSAGLLAILTAAIAIILHVRTSKVS
jgi:hypothetical protein